MIFHFNRIWTTSLLLSFCGLLPAARATEPIQAPESLEGAIIKITNPAGSKTKYRRVIRVGTLLSIGESGQEFHEGLKLTDPLILLDNNEEAIITDLEYSYKPASPASKGGKGQEAQPGSQAYLGFQYRKGDKDNSAQYMFDCDTPFSALESEDGLPYNIQFTHKDRHGLHGTIQGWEVNAEQDSSPDQVEYDILVTFSDGTTETDSAENLAENISSQQKKAYAGGKSLHPDFLNWVVQQRMEQIMSDKSSCMQYGGLYAPQVKRQKDRKLISREDMMLTQLTFIDKFPKRSYLIKQVGTLKNTVQITAAFLYIQASGREFSGYIRLTLVFNEQGQIAEVGEDLDIRKELKLSPGFKSFAYKGPTEFIAVN